MKELISSYKSKIKIIPSPTPTQPNRHIVELADDVINDVEIPEIKIISQPPKPKTINELNIVKKSSRKKTETIKADKKIQYLDLPESKQTIYVGKENVKFKAYTNPPELDIKDQSAEFKLYYNQWASMAKYPFVKPKDFPDVGNIEITPNKLISKMNVPFEIYTKNYNSLLWTKLPSFKNTLNFTGIGHTNIKVIPFTAKLTEYNDSSLVYSFKYPVNTGYEVSVTQKSLYTFHFLFKNVELNRYKLIFKDQNNNIIVEKKLINSLISVSSETFLKEKSIRIEFWEQIKNDYVYINETSLSLPKTILENQYDIKVTQYEPNQYVFDITNTGDELYLADNEIENHKEKSIVSKKKILVINIRRMDQGRVIDYGRFPINITKTSKFAYTLLDTFNVVQTNNNGFSFSWEDTEEFRLKYNIPNPSALEYNYNFSFEEYTLGFWECLYLNENQFITTDDTRGRYYFWKKEHPLVQRNIIPHDWEDRNESDVFDLAKLDLNFSFNIKSVKHPNYRWNDLFTNVSPIQKIIFVYDKTTKHNLKSVNFSLKPLNDTASFNNGLVNDIQIKIYNNDILERTVLYQSINWSFYDFIAKGNTKQYTIIVNLITGKKIEYTFREHY